VIAIVEHTSESFERRSLSWDLHCLPVPADIVIYTVQEWENLAKKENKFGRIMRREVIWTLN
jgi:hypothetical protein